MSIHDEPESYAWIKEEVKLFGVVLFRYWKKRETTRSLMKRVCEVVSSEVIDLNEKRERSLESYE